jgi:hypothetical protein
MYENMEENMKITENGIGIKMRKEKVIKENRVSKVGALCYKPEGCWFDSRWFHWNFSLK